MKKILSMLLIGCLTFSLAACVGNKSNTTGSYKPYSPHEVFSAWADVFNENTKPEEKRGLSKSHPFYEMYEATEQSGISGKASDKALKYIKGHPSYFQEMLTTVEYEDVRNSFFELAMDVDLSVSGKDLKKDATQYSDSLVLIYGTTSGLSEGIFDNGQFTTGGYISLQDGDNYDDYIEYYCIFNGIPPVSSGMDVVCIGVPLCLGQSTTGDDVICFAAAFIAPISGFGQIISESSGDIFDKYSLYFVQTFKVENNDEVDSYDAEGTEEDPFFDSGVIDDPYSIEYATGRITALEDIEIMSSPSYDSTQVSTLEKGNSCYCYINVYDSGYHWLQIGESQWIAWDPDLLEFEELDYSNPTDSEQVEAFTVDDAIGVIRLMEDLNVRTGPGTNYDTSYVLKRGDEVYYFDVVYGPDYTWYQVDVNEWVADNGEWIDIIQ